MKHTHESCNQSRKEIYNSEMEKRKAQELGFGNNYGTLCLHPFKDNTQSFYQSNSFVKSTDYTNESQNSGIETKSLAHENNLWNHKAETDFTRGTSRSETCNCPSCFPKPRASSSTPNHILILIHLSTHN